MNGAPNPTVEPRRMGRVCEAGSADKTVGNVGDDIKRGADDFVVVRPSVEPRPGARSDYLTRFMPAGLAVLFPY